MSLPPRGTGLLTGAARFLRGMGNPLTDAERRKRHYANSATAIDPIWIITGLVAASGAIILAVNALSKS
ncbi:unnamed protein product [marine sediment metagenome]|uniref:Uncharacterized protein n=1 Tax=marine sediment metagenome TaxID=412755 RepID=X1DWY5_9ZZZZ